MNEQKSDCVVEEKKTTNDTGKSRILFECTLRGTPLCEHPECSGYDDRKCDFWSRHSSK